MREEGRVRRDCAGCGGSGGKVKKCNSVFYTHHGDIALASHYIWLDTVKMVR